MEGFDYNEIFASVAKMTSVHCFLSVVIAKEWELYQMDVYNAFLHGDLEEEVYIQMLPGFFSKDQHKLCC